VKSLQIKTKKKKTGYLRIPSHGCLTGSPRQEGVPGAFVELIENPFKTE